MHSAFRWAAASVLLLAAPAFAAPPVSTDDRLVVELVASEPDLMTPTGVAVDERGRVWVIENNTHERPANYKGPDSDRVLVFSDFDESGKARKMGVYAEGFKNSMGLALRPDGAVYLATRSEIFILRGKDKAEDKRSIMKLDTTGTYPHDGLSGLAFDGVGDLTFGMGENLGVAYKLIGSRRDHVARRRRGRQRVPLQAGRLRSDAHRHRLLEPLRRMLRRLRPAVRRR